MLSIVMFIQIETWQFIFYSGKFNMGSLVWMVKLGWIPKLYTEIVHFTQYYDKRVHSKLVKFGFHSLEGTIRSIPVHEKWPKMNRWMAVV